MIVLLIRSVIIWIMKSLYFFRWYDITNFKISNCWFFYINSASLRTCTRSKRRKKTKTQQTNTAEQESKDLRGLAMCLHPRESAAPHHHIDHEIIISIQAATSFDLSWFLLFKTSLNHLALFLYWTLYFSVVFFSFSVFSLLKPHPYITWSRIYIYTLAMLWCQNHSSYHNWI